MKSQIAAGILLFAFITSAYSQTNTPPPDVVSSNAGNIRIERLATLEFPWGLALLPDGRLLVTEKPGRLRIWANGKMSEPVQGVPKVVFRGPSDQGGLLDVEIDPDFARNGFVYLSYVEAADPQPADARETDEPRFGGFLDLSDTIVRGGRRRARQTRRRPVTRCPGNLASGAEDCGAWSLRQSYRLRERR
jgi:hypothetical protein